MGINTTRKGVDSKADGKWKLTVAVRIESPEGNYKGFIYEETSQVLSGKANLTYEDLESSLREMSITQNRSDSRNGRTASVSFRKIVSLRGSPK